ncbi:MAG: hypothetical protein GDA42_02005 [Ekhidna sp.]|nr:hypothetical protein [Ekhidna sp.]
MKSLNNLTLSLITGILIFACTPKQGSNQGRAAEKTVNSEETAPDITLTKAPASPEYPRATLTKNDLSIEQIDSFYALNYSFDVQNYELGAQTADAATRGIANSGKGQHIHYIVNNGPYAAHYMAEVPDQLKAGNYVVLAFLSRSYHESVKSEGAYFIENITVGDVEPSEADLTAPHLFYSRPKGAYSGADTEKVMLDFYLLNETISPGGNKVKATINGSEFMIEEWAPHYIEGMPMGGNTIKLELIDIEGNLIKGPFNTVERIITLSE